MSQLIALIIAIALGAIVTAIGFVFLGDAFTRNSERGTALQLVSQASQVEMAMTAHRAEQAASAFDTDYQTTLDDGADAGLVTLGYLKDEVVAPQGTYSLLRNGADVFLVSSGANAAGTVISRNVCQEVEVLAGRDRDFGAVGSELVDVASISAATISTALDTDAYGCYTVAAAENFVFAYEVE